MPPKLGALGTYISDAVLRPATPKRVFAQGFARVTRVAAVPAGPRRALRKVVSGDREWVSVGAGEARTQLDRLLPSYSLSHHSECRTSATRVRAAQRAGSSEPSSATATPAIASRSSPGALKTLKTLSGMWSAKPVSAACIIAR